jgi:anti-sigma factor RsiW
MIDTTLTEADLHAYADGFLSDADRARVDRWIATDPQAAEQLQQFQAQNAAILTAFAGHARSLPGDHQLLTPQAPITARQKYRRALLQAAAAVLIFAAGTLSGNMLLPPFSTQVRPDAMAGAIAAALPEQAGAAYLIYAGEVRHPVEVGADQQAHLASWLGKKLNYAFNIPDLSAQGFKLVGGRLVPVSGKAGAMLMYEDGNRQRITVLVGRNDDNRSTSFRYVTAGSLETFYWIDGPIGYAVTGDISREKLQVLADECYRQFVS